MRKFKNEKSRFLEWNLSCLLMAMLWVTPLTMMLFGELVPMGNVAESNLLFVFWYMPAEAARESNMFGYLPSIIWVAIIWMVGLLIIKIYEIITRKMKK